MKQKNGGNATWQHGHWREIDLRFTLNEAFEQVRNCGHELSGKTFKW